jgi:putative ABC transport system permease protein
MDHEEKPFRVTGILARTFTPVDRSLYVTLQGIDAVHEGFLSEAQMYGSPGAPPANFAAPGGRTLPNFAAPDAQQDSAARAAPAGTAAQPAATSHEAHDAEHDAPPEQITAFFLGAKTRIATLQLQREVNTHEDEAVMAILPGVALAEMWRGVGYAEGALLIVTFFVVIVGLIGMLLSLYSSLEARRREMAILRALGTGARRIVALLVLESGLLGVSGVIAGVALVYALLALLKGFVESNFGLYLPIQAPSAMAFVYLGAVIVASFLLGLIPAIKAYRNSLADGLTVRI